MSFPRLQADGSLEYPKRGQPPDLQDGFVRDVTNPYHLLPVMPQCQYRFDGLQVLQCGKKIPFVACRKGFTAGFQECNQCIASGKRDS